MRRLHLMCLVLLLSFASWRSEAAEDPLTTFYRDVQQQLMHGDFSQLEATAAELRKTDERFTGSHAKLYHFYRALGSYRSSKTCKCFTDKEQALKRWLSERPQSLTVRLALGELFINYAWEARGSASAGDVSEEQWKLFRERLETAQSYVAELDPNDDPVVAVEHSDLAQLLFSSRPALDKIYAAAIQRYPRFFHFYADRANILQEKWFGEPGELARYTRSLLSSPGGDVGQVAYTYAAGRLVWQYEYKPQEIFEMTGLEWPLLKEAYRTRERLYGLRSEDLNIMLICAVTARDVAFAKELVPRIGDAWDQRVWRTKDYFVETVAWVLRHP